MFVLSEFDIQYQPAKAVKGQALADLIVERINTNIATLSVPACAMYFDGSACEDGCGIGMLLVSPRGVTYSFSVRLPALALTIKQRMKQCAGGWSYFLKPVQRR
jgi:hypothetical protein